MDDDKDRDAFRRCLAGDRGAFGEIIDRYQKTVLNITYRITNNYEDAKDLAQSAFVKAFQALPSYDPRHRVFSWLYRIAVNESLNFVKKRDRGTRPLPSWTAPHATPEDAFDEAERARKIEAVLGHIPARQRALLALSLDGFSYRDIGAILDLSEAKVKSRLFATRHKMRELLIREGLLAHGR